MKHTIIETVDKERNIAPELRNVAYLMRIRTLMGTIQPAVRVWIPEEIQSAASALTEARRSSLGSCRERSEGK